MTALDGDGYPETLFAEPSAHQLRRQERSPRRERKEDSSGSLWGLLCVVGFFVVVAVYSTEWSKNDYPLMAATLSLPVVFLVASLFVRQIHDKDYDVRSIMYLGLLLRLLGAYMRLQNTADSAVYHTEGIRLAASFRQLNFDVDTQRQIPGTGALRWISGMVHVFVFDNMGGAFLVFTMFGFIGCYFLYRAFVTAVPDGDRYRYALLLFLWPSLCYWPSSLGKEAWMLLGIGVASYGAALVFTQRSVRGFVYLALGIVGLTYVRPHVSLIVFIAMFVAFLVRRNTNSTRGTAVKGLGLAVLLIGGSVLVSQTQSFLKVDDSTGADVSSTLDNATEQTTQGGSAFQAHQVRTPLDFPLAFVTVVFRPFPNEARDINGLMTALESFFLLALFFTSARRLARLPLLLRSTPYITYAITYSIIFVYAFSSIGNFGILARQRTQLAPMVLVLAALPPGGKVVPRFGRKRRRAEAEAREEDVEIHQTWRDRQRVHPADRRKRRQPAS